MNDPADWLKKIHTARDDLGDVAARLERLASAFAATGNSHVDQRLSSYAETIRSASAEIATAVDMVLGRAAALGIK